MRRTKEEAEVTRQTLLDAALQVFSSKGYAATRLEDIADAANVTRGAIYHHFGGKAELFSALVVNASQRGDQAFAQAIREGGPFVEIGRRILEYTLKLLEEDTRYRETLALAFFNSHDSEDLADFQAMTIRSGQETIEQVTGFFQMGLQQGAIRSDLDPEIAARAFLAYQNGLTLLYLSVPGSIRSDQAAPLADIFIRGVQR
jgi:TetR/AcrR family transcriptional regulator, acrAB operon repressor